MTEAPGSKVESLSMVRAEMRADVHARYVKLKERGVNEESARNTAAAQCSTQPKAMHRAAAYRRELDALLAPRKHVRPNLSAGSFNWRNPVF